MNDLQIFKNTEFGEIRTMTIDNEPWFVGKDVAEVLGYTNPQKAVRDHIDDEDKTVNDLFSVNGTKGILINESGLYSLILSSKLPKAKEFKRWVTSEVLPAIRKHGVYAVDEVLNNPDMLIAALTELKTERAKREELEAENAIQKQQLIELNPKATYYDLVLQCKDLISTTQIAKDYGKSVMWLNKLLAENKVQFKQSDIWILYKKYAEQGYTQTKTDPYIGKDGKTHTRPRTCWTQKGRLFIYDFLKSLGILPIVERGIRNGNRL